MGTVADFFSQLGDSEKKSQNNNNNNQQDRPVEGSLLDLCKKENRGTTLLRPIKDVNNVPLRCIDSVWDVYESFPLYDAKGVPIVGEDGTPWKRSKHTFVMATQNYRCQLTPDQIALHNALLQDLQKYDDLVNEQELIDPDDPKYGITTGMHTTFRYKMTLFWAKILSLTVPGQGCMISDGAVRLCRHHGSTFRSDMATTIASKTAMKQGDGSWQEAFFNRDVGPQNAVMSCIVVQQQGFKNTMQFEENGPQYTLTETDVATAGDLFAAGDYESKPCISGLNATVYPESEMRDLYNRVHGYLQQYSNSVAAGVNGTQPVQPAVQPQVVNASAIQPTAAPVQPAAQPAPTAMPQVSVPPVQPQPAVTPQPVQPVAPVQPVVTQPVAAPVAPTADPNQAPNFATMQTAAPVQPAVNPIPGSVPVL